MYMYILSVCTHIPVHGCSQPREFWFIDFNHVCLFSGKLWQLPLTTADSKGNSVLLGKQCTWTAGAPSNPRIGVYLFGIYVHVYTKQANIGLHV